MATSRRAFLALCTGSAAAWLLRRDGAGHAPAPQRRAEAELAQASQTALLCSSVNAAGVGLRGEYFAGERCEGTPLLVRLDESIDFDATRDWPAGRHGARARSVRWSGWVKPAIAGRYRFHVDAADVHIVVARQPLAGRDAPSQAGIELAAGRFYPISVTLERLAPAAERIRLEWTAPHGARFVVPRALLYLPMEGLTTART